jgi:nitrite reductase/ring-hydroxylating ferredoxin subunit
MAISTEHAVEPAERPPSRVRAGALADLRREGRLLAKVGNLPVVVLWHDGQAWAIEDRCPHLGFPLHRGSVEAGLLTCHWHHARFDLASGCTLDPWADDARAFTVDVDGDEVWVSARADDDPAGRLRLRLRDGLEQGLTLVTAKATLGLLDIPGGADEVVRTALDFGLANRAAGWGSGLTVLVAMANVLPHLEPDDRALALVHALAFVARDTQGRPPRFPIAALDPAGVPAERLGQWYRRFVDTRSADAAERVLATAAAGPQGAAAAEAMQLAAVTDHVFLDEGHTLDFTNKAVEALAVAGPEAAGLVLTSLVGQTCRADRAEESSEWRHPHDLAGLVEQATPLLLGAVDRATAGPARPAGDPPDLEVLAWALLDDDPEQVVEALLAAAGAGATPEGLGRAVALAAALRITRFHVQNDHGDWDSVHHAFTTANALHQALARRPTPELLRGLLHGSLRVYLDRFLNVPAARLPAGEAAELADLDAVWDVQGEVDTAGAIVAGYLRAGGDRSRVIAALGHALLREDAGFHWFQVYEAGVRQALAWPDGSEASTLILVGVARWLAAHTPTMRELPTVVRIATRLRRGEALFEEA